MKAAPEQTTSTYLLADATGIQDKITHWRTLPTHQEGARKLLQALADHDLSASIFVDPNLDQYALLAYLDQQINLAQFTSCALHWGAHHDFSENLDYAEYHTITEVDCAGANALQPFLKLLSGKSFSLSSQGGEINVPLPSSEFTAFINELLDPSVHMSERSFTLLHLNPQASMPEIYYVLDGLGFAPFMPIHSDGHFQILIPSFSMLQAFINAISTTPFTLIPVIGETSAQSVLNFHQNGQHPLGLSIQGYSQSHADGLESKSHLFVVHDIYHISLLIFIPMMKLINQSAQLGLNFLLHNRIDDESPLQQQVGFLVDAELGQYFRIAVIEKYQSSYVEDIRTTLTPAISFSMLLARTLLKQLPQRTKLSALEQQQMSTLVSNILVCLINERQLWSQHQISISEVIHSCVKLPRYTDQIAQNQDNHTEAEEFIKASIESFEELSQIISNILTKPQNYPDLTPDSIDWIHNHEKLKQSLFSAVKMNDLRLLQESILTIKEQQLSLTLDCLNEQQKTPLFLAVKSKNHPCAKLLLEDGANPDVINGRETKKVVGKDQMIVLGTRALHLAAEAGDVQMIELLIQSGAQLDVYDGAKLAPLDITLQRGHVQATTLLLSHCDVSNTHFERLSKKGQIDDDCITLVKSYLDLRNEYIEIIEKNDTVRFRNFRSQHPEFRVHCNLEKKYSYEKSNSFLLMPKSSITSAVELACAHSDYTLLAELFVNTKPTTEIFTVCLSQLKSTVIRTLSWNAQSLKLLTCLLENGLDLNQALATRNDIFSAAKIETLWTSLLEIDYARAFFALMPTDSVTMSIDARKLCITYGANVNAFDRRGMAQLHYAISINDLSYATFLLEHSADINAFDQSKDHLGTALHLACAEGNVAMVKLLLAHGAGIALVNRMKFTALELAKFHKHERAIAPLFGVDPDDVKLPTQNPYDIPALNSLGQSNELLSLDYIGIFDQHPEFKKTIGKLSSNPSIKAGAFRIAQALNAEDLNFNSVVFTDHNIWHFALCAFNMGMINEITLSTLAIRLAYLNEFDDSIDLAQTFTIHEHDQTAANTLRRFLSLLPNQENNIVNNLRLSKLSALERTFTVITLKNNAYFYNIMKDFTGNCEIPLLPIEDGDKLLVLIPSFSILTTIIEKTFENPVRLKPLFGQFDTLQQCKAIEHNNLPMPLCAEMAQSFNGIFGSFARALLLSANPNRLLIARLITLTETCAIQYPTLKSKDVFESFANMEVLQAHYTQTMAKMVNPQSLIAKLPLQESILLGDFCRHYVQPIELFERHDGVDDSTLEPDNDHVLSEVDGAYRIAIDELIICVLKNMVEQRNDWLNHYHFSVSQFIDLLRTNQQANFLELCTEAYKTKYTSNFSFSRRENIFSLESMLMKGHEQKIAKAILRSMNELHDLILQRFVLNTCLSEADQQWFIKAWTARERLSTELSTEQSSKSVLETLNQLLELNFDFTTPLYSGEIILNELCKKNNTAAVELLLRHGIKVNQTNSSTPSREIESGEQNLSLGFMTTPVHIAVINNNLELLKLLLQYDANLEMVDKHQLSALDYAIINGQTEMAGFLLKKIDVCEAHFSWLGAHHKIPEQTSAVIDQYLSFRTKLLQFLSADHKDKNIQCHEQELMLFLSTNMFANLNCRFEENNVFEDQKANNKYQHWPKEHRYTRVLHKAETSEIIELLIKKGADPNSTDHNGATALQKTIDDLTFSANQHMFINPFYILAVQNTYLRKISTLLALGANPFIFNTYNCNALTAAIKAGNPTLAREILSKTSQFTPSSEHLNQLIHLTKYIEAKRSWDANSCELFKLLPKSSDYFQSRYSVRRSLFDKRNLFSAPKTNSTWQYLRDTPVMKSFFSLDEPEQSAIKMPIDMRIIAIQTGADPNEPALDGTLEIFYALKNKSAQYVLCLLEHDVSLKVLDAEGRSPIQVANIVGDSACIKALTNHHATSIPTLGFLTPEKRVTDEYSFSQSPQLE